MAFKGAGSLLAIIALAGGLAMLLPRPTHAGFFSALAKFFNTSSAGAEEQFPVLVRQSRAAPPDPAIDADNRPPSAPGGDADANLMNINQENAIVAPLNPLGIPPPADSTSSGGQIFFYTVRPGDTFSTIAKSFDVSVNTILWANNISNNRALSVGQQIVILPVSGVRHEVRKGDTVAAIARKYRAAMEDILQFNGLALDEEPAAGTTIIVPDGELPQSAPLTPGASSGQYFANLPLYDGFYARPIAGGRRSRGIHGFNGIDLANSCGLPVFASADGTVIIARSGGWNGGYGRYVVISHANNTQTLYAHMSSLAVAPGQFVRRSEVIGAIGSTGNSTGCHVHFEVRGARNPF